MNESNIEQIVLQHPLYLDLKQQVDTLKQQVSELQTRLKKYTTPDRRKKYYENHKSEIIQKVKEYQDNLKLTNPEKLKQYRKNWYKNKQLKNFESNS